MLRLQLFKLSILIYQTADCTVQLDGPKVLGILFLQISLLKVKNSNLHTSLHPIYIRTTIRIFNNRLVYLFNVQNEELLYLYVNRPLWYMGVGIPIVQTATQ